MAGIVADGKFWEVTTDETHWVFSFSRKGAMYPTIKRIARVGTDTIQDAAKALEAAELAAYVAKNSPAQVAVKLVAKGAAAVVTAPARTFCRCSRCRTTGYAGSYPFSTNARIGICDDCGI